MTRDRWDASRDKRRAVESGEASGEIVDSMKVRIALVERVKAGEMTLEEAQAELRRIKRTGPTRASVWRSA